MPRTLVSLLALLLAALALPAVAQDYPPRPEGPVYDGADLLTPQQEQALNAQLRTLPADTGTPIVVATVPDLDGQTVEQYAVGLYEEWGIGDAELDTGVLFLIARDDRKMRIETGYGTGPIVTDIWAGRLIRNEITPLFKQGDFAEGIAVGVNALIQQVSASPAEAAAAARAAERAEAEQAPEPGSVIGSAIMWFIFIVMILALFGGRRGRKRRRYGAGSAMRDVILWNAIGSAASSGRGWGGLGGGGGGGFGGFGGGISGGGGASGGW